jgi:hypothetical protein
MTGNPAGAQARPMAMNRKHATAALAVLAACAGCGTQVATVSGGAPPARAAASPSATACDNIPLANKLITLRQAHLIDPSRMTGLQQINDNATQVQAVFRDLCAVVTHPAHGVYSCPADLGAGYTGTFYDDTRVLATFAYDVTGCQLVTLRSITGKTQQSIVAGPAAQAAPQLEPDFAKVVHVPVSRLYHTGLNNLSG